MALRRLRTRRQSGRVYSDADRDGETQRRRSPGLARRRTRTHRRSAANPAPRVAPLELEAAQPATGCVVNRERSYRGPHRMLTKGLRFPGAFFECGRPAEAAGQSSSRTDWWVMPSQNPTSLVRVVRNCGATSILPEPRWRRRPRLSRDGVRQIKGAGTLMPANQERR